MQELYEIYSIKFTILNDIDKIMEKTPHDRPRSHCDPKRYYVPGMATRRREQIINKNAELATRSNLVYAGL